MGIGVIGRKVGMTSVFAEDGTMVPVSVVEIEPNTVTALRTAENDGYTAVQLGTGTQKKLTRPRAGQLKGLPPVKHTREFRLDDLSGYSIGQKLDVSLFAEGEEVDVTGTSKGKGFAGTMKRHGFKGQGAAHGAQAVHRRPGSIGGCATPGRVFKGTRMSGRMGSDRITTQNLVVHKVDAANGVLLIKGAVPGRTGGLVMVRTSVKRGGVKRGEK